MSDHHPSPARDPADGEALPERPDFHAAIREDLAGIQAQGLYRQLRRVDSPQGAQVQLEGRELRNFSSNDYLGLANHPALKEAAARAARDFGAGSGASRLICGSLAPHHELEDALARFKKTEAALAFSSGFATALGAIGALVANQDVVALDRLAHASLIDAARLSGAKLRVFAHDDLESLEKVLRWAQARRSRRVLVVTESVFSMDGDQAPLRALVDLKEKYGAWLMVDEAHATGLYGREGRGLADAEGVAGRIEVQMGTLGKSLGAAGGYVCGSRALADLLVNRARSFIFSTAPVPAAAAAARTALTIVADDRGEALRAALWERVAQFKAGLAETAIGFAAPLVKRPSAIIPLIVGSEARAVRWADQLRAGGILAPAIRYPTVARGQARLRVTLSAAHGAEDVNFLLAALRDCALPSD